ncbi:MAG: hypothetical protein ACRCVT_05705, partial [Leadbetterella sp.]
TGSENTVVMGITFQATVNCNVNNIRFTRCRFQSDFFIISSNCTMEQSIFHTIGGNTSMSNNIIRNCIIVTHISSVNNTTFDQCYLDTHFNVTQNNNVFTNSIIKTISATFPTTNTFTNCMRIGGTFPISGINNNIENVVLANVFVVSSPTGLIDKDYRLKAGSPAIATGTAGQDMGPFGALPSGQPYRLSGQAAIPIITNFNMSSVGSTASGLVGSITIQSNN